MGGKASGDGQDLSCDKEHKKVAWTLLAGQSWFLFAHSSIESQK